MNSASSPARPIAPLPTSSRGRTSPKSRLSSSLMATPSRTRSRPACQVPSGTESSLKSFRWGASSPQWIPLADTHASSWAKSSSSNRKRRRTGSRSARSRICDAVSRPPTSSRTRATTPSTGFVWRNERSASLTRRPGSGSTSGLGLVSESESLPAPPKVAWMSGAKVSISGHITITSLGSSEGSSLNACRMASRSTST